MCFPLRNGISRVSKILYKRRLWENPLFSGYRVVSSGTRMETQKAACTRDLSRLTTLVIRNGVLIHGLNQVEFAFTRTKHLMLFPFTKCSHFQNCLIGTLQTRLRVTGI